MAEEVGALRVSVRANAAEIQADMGKIGAIVNSASARMSRSMSAFRDSASRATGEIFNLRNAAIGVAGGAFLALIKRAVQYGDDIQDTAEQIGITTKSLQELRYVAQLSGVATDQFDQSMLQFSKRLGEAQLESNEVSKALNRLGISISQVKGLSPDQVFKLVADRLPTITSGFQQAAIASDLFGRAGTKLVPTLLQGSAGIAKIAAEAHNMGLVLSDETIKKAGEANDVFDQMGTALQVAGVKAAAELLPVLKEIRATITSREFQQGIIDFAEGVGKIVKWIVENKSELADIGKAFVAFRVVGAINPALGTAAGALTYFGSKLDDVNDQAAPFKEAVRAARLELANFEEQLAKETDYKKIEELKIKIFEAETKVKKAGDALKQFFGIIDKGPTQVEIGKSPPLVSDEVLKQIKDLEFQADILNGKFKAFSPTFPEAARNLKLFGTTAENTVTEVAKLSPELQLLDQAMARLEAAKVIDGIKTSTERYNEQFARYGVLAKENNWTQEQFNAAVNKFRFPSLTQAIDDAQNLYKQLDQFSTRSLDGTADALTDIVTGSKSAKEAFSDLAKSVVRDLVAMTIKAMVFRTVGGFLFGFEGGGSVDINKSILGFSNGGLVRAATGGSIVGRGTGTSDSIPALVSNGEYIIRAAQADKYRNLLDAINSGELDRSAPSSATANSSANVTLVVKSRTDRPMVEAMADALNGLIADGYSFSALKVGR